MTYEEKKQYAEKLAAEWPYSYSIIYNIIENAKYGISKLSGFETRIEDISDEDIKKYTIRMLKFL